MEKITVCHFDINGTIIMFDSTDNATPAQAVCEIISRNIYGSILGKTFELAEEGEIVKDPITYYDYLKKMHPTQYKSMCYDLLLTYPQYQDLATDLIQAYNQGIFKSMHKVLEVHPKIKLVFRTFGHDGDYVIDQLAPKKFIKLCTIWDDDICRFVFDNKIINLNEFILGLDADTHVLVQDDYKTWSTNSREKWWGKVIYSHGDLIQYGFDDNPCMYGIGDDIMVHKIDTIEAATNENYFVDMMLC
jgi:hypothetical protein